MTRLKNSIFASAPSAAINPRDLHRPGTGVAQEPYAKSASPWRSDHSSPQYPSGERVSKSYFENGIDGGNSPDGGVIRVVDAGMKSAWGKLRSLVGPAVLNPGNAPVNYGPYGYPQQGSSYEPPQQRGYYQTPPMYSNQNVGHARGPPVDASQASWRTPSPGARLAPSRESSLSTEVRTDQENLYSAEAISTPLRDMAPNTGTVGGYHYGNRFDSPTVPERETGHLNHPPYEEPGPISPPEILIPPEPQIFVSNGCIVLIPRPAEYFKKKKNIIDAGSNQLHVFTDFERTMTHFRAPNGGLANLMFISQFDFRI